MTAEPSEVGLSTPHLIVTEIVGLFLTAVGGFVATSNVC